MTCRRLRGLHPSGEVGLWVSKPGFDCLTDDRTDRNKFFVSTSFPNRRPFRIISSGFVASNTAINLPGSLASLGGEPLLAYRVMLDSATEREVQFYGNGTSNPAYSGSEFFSRFSDGNPAFFAINYRPDPTSKAYLLRYMVFLY